MSSEEDYSDEDFEDFDDEGEELEYEEDEAEREDEEDALDDTEEGEEEVLDEVEAVEEPKAAETLEDIFEGQSGIIYEEYMKVNITSKRMTHYEMEELIGIRAKMIEDGDKVYTDITGLKDPIKMAERELYARRCPIKLKREIDQKGNVVYIEVWNVREMDLPKRHG
jgi:DNA-directed RNA polymerases I, II, and III subunit RPABC2